MFKNTKEIIGTLEDAIKLFGETNSAISREKAKLMVVASRHALQALALDFAEKRFPISIDGMKGAIDVESTGSSKNDVRQETRLKGLRNKVK